MDKFCETPTDWLSRAKSNLLRGKQYNPAEKEIYIEDFCFDLQQCVEKSLKAVLLSCGIDFPKTHDIACLITLIKNRTTVEVPENIEISKKLTGLFPMQTRYPCPSTIEIDDYNETVEIAENVYNWAKNIVETGN